MEARATVITDSELSLRARIAQLEAENLHLQRMRHSSLSESTSVIDAQKDQIEKLIKQNSQLRQQNVELAAKKGVTPATEISAKPEDVEEREVHLQAEIARLNELALQSVALARINKAMSEKISILENMIVKLNQQIENLKSEVILLKLGNPVMANPRAPLTSVVAYRAKSSEAALIMPLTSESASSSGAKSAMRAPEPTKTDGPHR